MSILSNNLRLLRKKKGLRQDDLAEKFGYKSFTTIQKWEDGTSEPSVGVLQGLSKLYGVTMDMLVNEDLSVTPEPTIAAHHDGEWSPAEKNELEQFKEYIKSKRDK